MTRKEVIDQLQDAKSGYKEYLSSEAIDMAIKALEQEPTIKNDLIVDAVSREKAITWAKFYTDIYGAEMANESIMEMLRNLPSVTPQEPRKGHWIEEFNDLEGEVRFTCSSCGKYQLFGTDFCYHCGSDNREVEE